MKQKLLNKYQPFKPYFKLTERNRDKKAPYQFAYIYKLFAYSSKLDVFLKYIIRAEAYEECFAVKFYCSRAKHSPTPYSKVLNVFNASEVKKIIRAATEVIMLVLQIHPEASFFYSGASTNIQGIYTEKEANNQRYRIYKELLKKYIAGGLFEIITYPGISASVFINLKSPGSVEDKERRILSYLEEAYNFEI